MTTATAEQDIYTYLPPYYLAVKIDNDNFTFLFYKWDGSNNYLKCCKPTLGEIVFEEAISRRIIQFSNIIRVNTIRLGYVYFANGKKYNVYKFEIDPRLHLKNCHNEFTLSLDKFNYTLIKQKIEALGPWPATFHIVPARTVVEGQPLPPTYVSNLLISDAITKNETCPINYDTITKENAVVTSCFHVFSREALTVWRKKSTECPKCRAICSVTV